MRVCQERVVDESTRMLPTISDGRRVLVGRANGFA